MNKYGIVSTYEAAETYALLIVEIVHIAKKERAQVLRQVEQANTELAKIEEIKKELQDSIKEKNIVSQLYLQLKKSHADLKNDLQKATDSMKAAEEANSSMAAELEAWKNSIVALTEELKSQKAALEL